MKPAPSVLTQEVEGETVLLDTDKGIYYALDDVGTRIWTLLAQHGDADEVIAVMLEEFEVDEQTLRKDVETLVAKLTAAGLLVAEGTE